jgi:hypothetical protein
MKIYKEAYWFKARFAQSIASRMKSFKNRQPWRLQSTVLEYNMLSSGVFKLYKKPV